MRVFNTMFYNTKTNFPGPPTGNTNKTQPTSLNIHNTTNMNTFLGPVDDNSSLDGTDKSWRGLFGRVDGGENYTFFPPYKEDETNTNYTQKPLNIQNNTNMNAFSMAGTRKGQLNLGWNASGCVDGNNTLRCGIG